MSMDRNSFPLKLLDCIENCGFLKSYQVCGLHY
jgi:hypothetical protein